MPVEVCSNRAEGSGALKRGAGMRGGEESAGSGYAHRESKLSGELLRRERRAARSARASLSRDDDVAHIHWTCCCC